MTDRRVDVLIGRAGRWADAFAALRAVLLDCGMEEGFKWRQAAYMVDGKNVLILSTMRDSIALNFFKGALMADPKGRLEVPGPNSQSARWMKFDSAEQVRAERGLIRSYIMEAMEIQRSGQTVDFKAKDDLRYPAELTDAMARDPDFAAAFGALTPGRQRSWVMQYGSAKQAATRQARVARSRDKVLAGLGSNERPKA